ncbi:iron complex transport system ATP-binding protein [Arthrobacter sp. PL16]|nr:iron complex transport system ATP-binding protein [Arthrobacter sp. PL16]
MPTPLVRHPLLRINPAGAINGMEDRPRRFGGFATEPLLSLVSRTMWNVLELAGVSLIRGGKTLLDEIDWQVGAGERWVVMGPNGAGKTTLLQLAGARLHPTRGVVGILDEVMGAVDVFELRPRIGLASAALASQVPDHETVLNVVVTASYGVTGRWREQYERLDERRAFRLLDTWGMSRFMNRPFGSLSEGERKRVQIARALMADPELLLLDEPAAGLDLAGREDLVKRLTELARDEDAPAMVLVTHHLEEVPPGFTHALLLRDGKMVSAGPIGVVLTEENLSAAFDVALKVTEENGRYSAVARA